MIKKWTAVSFLNLFIAGTLGFILRIFQYYSISFPYGNFLHAHSHIAILGWLYQIFYILIYLYFIPKNKKNKSSYSILFWITQLTIVGMFLSFPVQGYGLFSILFSSLHILCSYYFCYITFKNLVNLNDISNIFLKSALICMLISSLGIWGLGIIMGTLGKSSVLYSLCIQFYLHFQINGWFLLGSLALLLRLIYLNSYLIIPKIANCFYVSVLAGILLLFGLPLSWFIHSFYIYFSYCIGILCNITALIIFLKFIQPYLLKSIKSNYFTLSLLYGCFISSFLLKNFFQLFLFDPKISQLSHEIKNLRIGFIHLEVLGMYTTLSFALLMQQNQWIDSKNKLIEIGTLLFLIFYFISETLLFLQGFLIYLGKELIPNYFCILSWSSLLFPLSSLIYLLYLYKK
jgi:hypothetical protein